MPKVGMRAARPNKIWHVDTTLIRLLDGEDAARLPMPIDPRWFNY